MKFSFWVLLICFVGAGMAPVFSKGINLAEMKKKEDERRKNLAKSKLAINDTNINSITVGGKKYGFIQMESSERSSEAETSTTPGNEIKAESNAEETKQPDFWKKQQTELQERIDKLREDIDGAQLDLNKLWSDFYTKNIQSEQDAIKIQISELTNQIEQKKLFLSESESKLEDLYEKARKAGIPPGWLR